MSVPTPALRRPAGRHLDPLLFQIVGYWFRAFNGWVAYHEPAPLIRHDVSGWGPISDPAAVIAIRFLPADVPGLYPRGGSRHGTAMGQRRVSRMAEAFCDQPQSTRWR
jgi:hypothetical protein